MKKILFVPVILYVLFIFSVLNVYSQPFDWSDGDIQVEVKNTQPLTISSIGNKTIVSWNKDNNAIYGYSITVKDLKTGYFKSYDISKTYDTKFEISNLENGQPYLISVSSISESSTYLYADGVTVFFKEKNKIVWGYYEYDKRWHVGIALSNVTDNNITLTVKAVCDTKVYKNTLTVTANSVCSISLQTLFGTEQPPPKGHYAITIDNIDGCSIHLFQQTYGGQQYVE